MADVNSDDYYKVLGVDRNASEQEIAKAYKKLALKHHPDKNPDDKPAAEERFKKITDAYDVLNTPEKRKNYDQFGKAGLQGGGGGFGGSGGVSFQQADDIFKAFFGGQDPFSMFFQGGDDGFPGMFGGAGGPRVVFQQGPGGKGGMGGGDPFGGMFFGGGMPGMGGMGGMPGMGKGMGKAAPRRAPTPAYALPDGTTVTIRGLQKAQEHNDKTGKIAGWDEAKSRYNVSIEGEESLSLKPSNLTQRCTVELTGLSQDAVNGQSAEIVKFMDENSRYVVKLRQRPENGRDVIGVQASNVIIPKGTRVIVTGLASESAKQFNGQMAQIVDFDRDAQRYTVQCQKGNQLKIKLENVLC
jgi:curved DNA-binding protein CbpA